MPNRSKPDLSNVSLNLTGSVSKTDHFQERDVNELVKIATKKAKILTLNKTNSRKSQIKNAKQHQKQQEINELKTQFSNTQFQHSNNQEDSIVEPNTSLKLVKIFPHNKNLKTIRINPTAAVVFSSAAASYHRTPFLNAAQQEPNILQQLLSKEIEPFSAIDRLINETPVITAEVVLNKNENISAIEIGDAKELIKVPDSSEFTLSFKNLKGENIEKDAPKDIAQKNIASLEVDYSIAPNSISVFSETSKMLLILYKI